MRLSLLLLRTATATMEHQAHVDVNRLEVGERVKFKTDLGQTLSGKIIDRHDVSTDFGPVPEFVILSGGQKFTPPAYRITQILN